MEKLEDLKDVYKSEINRVYLKEPIEVNFVQTQRLYDGFSE